MKFKKFLNRGKKKTPYDAEHQTPCENIFNYDTNYYLFLSLINFFYQSFTKDKIN